MIIGRAHSSSLRTSTYSPRFRGRADRARGVACQGAPPSPCLRREVPPEGRGRPSPGRVVVGRRSSTAPPSSALPGSALVPLLLPRSLSARPLCRLFGRLPSDRALHQLVLPSRPSREAGALRRLFVSSGNKVAP